MKHRMPTFTFHMAWVDALSGYPTEMRHTLFDALLQYVSLGEEPEFYGVEKIAFDFMKNEVDQELYSKQNEKKPKRKAKPKEGVEEIADNEIQTDKPNLVPALGRMARKCFEEYFRETFQQEYYWEAKDARNMAEILKKLANARVAKGLSTDDDSLVEALRALLPMISDPWILQHFSVTTINSKYNELVSNIYKSHKDGLLSKKQAANVHALNDVRTDYNAYESGLAPEMSKPF